MLKELFSILTQFAGEDFDYCDKESIPAVYEQEFEFKEKQPLCKWLKFIKVKHKVIKKYKIKFYKQTYFNIGISTSFKRIRFSNDLELFCEVDEVNNIIYIADRHEEAISKFFKEKEELEK